jgi:hypothetical protein
MARYYENLRKKENSTKPVIAESIYVTASFYQFTDVNHDC